MEIERKWLVTGWPKHLKAEKIYQMDQGYIALNPTVRIRKEDQENGPCHYVLCFKGHGGLAREEIETDIDPDLYQKLCRFIGQPLIHKERRDYPLKDGLTLEVNLVDQGQPSSFFYAEVEYPTKENALSWRPDADGLCD